MISPLQNTNSQETDFHASGGIRTGNPSKRATADPSLRPRGHRDWPMSIIDHDYEYMALVEIKSLGKSKYLEKRFKMYIKIWCEYIELVHFAPTIAKSLVPVNTVMNDWVPCTTGLFTDCKHISISRTLLKVSKDKVVFMHAINV